MGSCVLSATGRNVALRDSIAYVAMGSGGLVCVNVRDPGAPSVVGDWTGRSSGVSLSDTIAYVAGPYTGLVSLSVADPSSPYVIDSLHLSDTLWWNDVAVSGSLVYVGGERVLTVDVSDPADLRVRGSSSPPYLMQRLAYSSPYLYAACLEAGVCIYESTAVGLTDSHPEQLVQASRLRVEPNPARARVFVSGAGSASDIRVFDAIGRDVTASVLSVHGSGLICVNIDRLPEGLYFVCERDKEVKSVVKLVKQ